ncbi:MAG: DNA-3-methyladenine glycosylase I [Rhodospirillales bacterium]
MSWYCDVAPGHPFHGPYHDKEYGFPLKDETALFERQSLEIFQAGLSWLLVLKKRPAMVAAFDGFEVDRVAAFKAREINRLLKDEGIIRNRLKVESIIENAKRVRDLRDSHGGFAKWIAAQHPLPKSEWVKVFRKTFKFMGGEIVGEFLMSIGYLPDAHHESCPVFGKIAKKNPPWMRVDARVYRESDK